MRRFVSGGLCALMIALLLVSIAGVAKAGQPEILINEMRIELGEVFQAEKFSHTFKVKNVGDADLEIKSVKPG